MMLTLTRHQFFSYIKSAVRIVGYIMLAYVPYVYDPWKTMWYAGMVLIAAEVLGILEEVGQAYGK